MLKKFHHILVPLEFTTKNLTALDIAFEMAAHNRSKITLLHVVQKLADSEDDEEIGKFYSRLEQRATDELDQSAERFRNAGLSIDCETRLGDRAAEIVTCGEEQNCDLIIMSSHPVDPEKVVASLWTVSYQVSILCRCPILLVKQDATPFQDVVEEKTN